MRCLPLAVLVVLGGGCPKSDPGPDEATVLRRLAQTERERNAAEARSRNPPFKDEGATNAVAATSNAFGLNITAARRLFLIDASGSMRDRLSDVTATVRNAIERLDERTAFNVVVFREDAFLAMEPRWQMADADGKAKADDFVRRLRPEGSSDPIPGFRAGFSLKPDVIFLISDGDFPNNPEVLTEIARLNAGRAAKIHAIDASADDDPGSARAFLRAVADQNGGSVQRLR